MTGQKQNPIRQTDEAARNHARLLLRGAPFGAIAVFDPETGYPNCSRVLLGTAHDGTPVILVSRLSAHTNALLADPRASLLVGEPGSKGDPLTWPRLTIQCDAEPVPRESEADSAIRARFVRRHKKAALYAGFADFLFIRLRPLRASLNGGFGRAYMLTEDDLRIDPAVSSVIAKDEEALLENLNRKWKGHVQQHDELEAHAGYKVVAVDPEGFDLKRGGSLKRILFRKPLSLADAKQLLEEAFFPNTHNFSNIQN